MPAIVPVTLLDAEATPITHTFSPVSIVGPLATYEDRSGGIQVGYPTLTVSQVRPSKTSRLNKVRVKLVVPVMETLGTNTVTGITPQPTKAFEDTVDITFILHERATTQHRKNLLRLAQGMIALDGGAGIVAAMVENLEAVY